MHYVKELMWILVSRCLPILERVTKHGITAIQIKYTIKLMGLYGCPFCYFALQVCVCARSNAAVGSQPRVPSVDVPVEQEQRDAVISEPSNVTCTRNGSRSEP